MEKHQIKKIGFYKRKAIEYCEKNNIAYKYFNGILIVEKDKEEFEKELWEYIYNDARTDIGQEDNDILW